MFTAFITDSRPSCIGCACRTKVPDRGEAILSFGISGMDDLLDLEPSPPPLRRFDFLLLALAVLLGFSLRLYIARAAFATSFDSSTVGLMAMRILEGDRPLFYYGQLYMGSLEAYVAALMFAVFGVSTTILALSPILFSVALIIATFFLFREISAGERWVAFAAALSVAASSVHGGIRWRPMVAIRSICFSAQCICGCRFVWHSDRCQPSRDGPTLWA
jgi:hypothetical protein